MGDRAKCIKVCPTDTFLNEYIAVGTILDIEGIMVVRIDPFGFPEIICEVQSGYFKEHFILLLEGQDD